MFLRHPCSPPGFLTDFDRNIRVSVVQRVARKDDSILVCVVIIEQDGVVVAFGIEESDRVLGLRAVDSAKAPTDGREYVEAVLRYLAVGT